MSGTGSGEATGDGTTRTSRRWMSPGKDPFRNTGMLSPAQVIGVQYAHGAGPPIMTWSRYGIGGDGDARDLDGFGRDTRGRDGCDSCEGAGDQKDGCGVVRRSGPTCDAE